MAIRYVVSDLDGTLLNAHNALSEYTLEVLRRAQAAGIGVILASGRMYHSILPFARAIGTPLPIISGNGAMITDAQTGETLHSDPLPAALAREVALLLEEKNYYFHGYDEQGFFYADPSQYSELYGRETSLPGRAVGRLSAYIQRDTPKMLATVSPEEVPVALRLLADKFGDRLELSSSSATLVEITTRTANKGSALRVLCKRLGAELSEVVAFGDGLNDLTMLQAAGRGVAVANAQLALRQIAADICDAHTEDGVARYIATHLLGQ